MKIVIGFVVGLAMTFCSVGILYSAPGGTPPIMWLWGGFFIGVLGGVALSRPAKA